MNNRKGGSKMSDTQRKKILELFEANFEDGDIEDYFNTIEGNHQLIKPILREEGFDMDAIKYDEDLEYINFKLEPKSLLSYDEWTNIYIAKNDLENLTNEEADAMIDDYLIFTFIEKHASEHISFEVIINDTPEAFANRHPSLDFFHQEVTKNFSESEFYEYAKEERHILESQLSNYLRYINFPETDPSKVRYEIKKHKYANTSYESLVKSLHIYYVHTQDDFDLGHYVGSAGMYNDFLIKAIFDFEILDDPEDFENEED